MFKDHFSGHAGNYARYRPNYPLELFAYLASLASQRNLAWDVATGNGQAAVGLTSHFARVVATDAAENQIRNAAAHENIEYRIEAAEASSLAPASVDLITVSQALHWLNLDLFYAEVRRVAVPDGVIAAWCYGNCSITPPIDRVVRHFYDHVVGPFWPPERFHLENAYQTLAFPFVAVHVPCIRMQAHWDLDEFLGYLGTWSATQRFVAAKDYDPRTEVADALARAWGSPTTQQRIQWPLKLLAGSIN